MPAGVDPQSRNRRHSSMQLALTSFTNKNVGKTWREDKVGGSTDCRNAKAIALELSNTSDILSGSV
jgi:hypothetical protein